MNGISWPSSPNVTTNNAHGITKKVVSEAHRAGIAQALLASVEK
jgi:hypothetical protein